MEEIRIKLGSGRWPTLPDDAELVVTPMIYRDGFLAVIPAIGETIEVEATTSREAMRELADKVRLLCHRRLTGTIKGAERHDRGWPKVAA